MRIAILAHLACIAACGGLDRGAPFLVDAYDAAGTRLGVADTRAPLAAPLAQSPTLANVTLIFSERLDGAAIQEVVSDDNTGAVRELVGRDGVVRIAPADGSVIAESIAYHPEMRAIRVVPRWHLPAETAVLIHVMAERIWDPGGNPVPVARYADGEPVRDHDGRGIAATVALVTEPIQMVSVNVPAYGTVDDPSTEEDETIPYDAAIALELNTALDPTSVIASVRSDRGDVTTMAASADGTTVSLSPLAPLASARAYELRIDDATDLYGVPWRQPPLLLTFSTR